MGRMQPVVMAAKNPFLPSSASPPLSYLLQYVGLAGIRTHDLQQLNQAPSHMAIMPAPTFGARGGRQDGEVGGLATLHEIDIHARWIPIHENELADLVVSPQF